jgi:Phage head-tail joining protein
MLPKRLSTGVRFTGASEFNRRITILKPGEGADTEGTPVALVTLATNVPAKITGLRNLGKPDQTQQLTQAVTYYEVVIRYRPDVPYDAILLGPKGQTWTVTNIHNVEMANIELRINVREINGGKG